MYTDFSTSSIKIGQKRSQWRKLHNIIWIQTWIEDIRFLGLGIFEMFQSSGVLHHLKSPVLGGRLLKDILVARGGSSIMVYAKLGRTGVYQIQKLMNMINENTIDVNAEIKNTMRVMDSLPKRN